MAATTPTRSTSAGPAAGEHPGLAGWWSRAGRRLGRLVAVGVHLALGAVLASYYVAWGRLRGRPHPRLPRTARWWHGRACRALGVAVRVVRGAPAAGALLVANHVSWLDIPVLGSLLPTGFVSKAEVASWPLIGWLAGVGGTLFIPRGGHQASAMAEAIGRRLAAGRTMVVFPEGTTTDGSGLRPFFPRLLAGAVAAGVPIQPVALRYPFPGGAHPTAPFVGDETFVAHLWRVAGDPGIEAEVYFCPPLALGEADRKTLARWAREAIAAELGLPLDAAGA